MYNIGIEKLKDASYYFNRLPVPNYQQRTVYSMKLSSFGYHDDKNDDDSNDNINADKIKIVNDE